MYKMKNKYFILAINLILINISYFIPVKANNAVTPNPGQITNTTANVHKQTLDNATCEVNEDCGHFSDDENIVCVNKRCRCGPDYLYNLTSRTCELSECHSHQDCNEYDENRRCDPIKGKCACKNIFMEAPYSKLCYPKITGGCNKTADCTLGGEQNVVCANGHCRCKVNFRYGRSQNACVKFNCGISLDCREYDNNRKCSTDRKCVCDTGFMEDHETLLCVQETYANKSNPAHPPPYPAPPVNLPGQPTIPPQQVGAVPTIKHGK